MINFSNQEMQLSGQITYDNAESYYQQGLKVIQSQSYPVVVNLAQLEHGSTWHWRFWCVGYVKHPMHIVYILKLYLKK